MQTATKFNSAITAIFASAWFPFKLLYWIKMYTKNIVLPRRAHLNKLNHLNHRKRHAKVWRTSFTQQTLIHPAHRICKHSQYLRKILNQKGTERKYENVQQKLVHTILMPLQQNCATNAQNSINFLDTPRNFWKQSKHLRILVKHLKHAPSFPSPRKKNLSVLIRYLLVVLEINFI